MCRILLRRRRPRSPSLFNRSPRHRWPLASQRISRRWSATTRACLLYTSGDYGNICLAVGSTLGSTTACQEPITLAPAVLTFPAQTVGTNSAQTITLSNTSGTALSGLALKLVNIPASAANFTETDACGLEGVPAQGEPFNLASGQSCAITIVFAPQCATQCASPLTATLTVTSPVTPDNDTA